MRAEADEASIEYEATGAGRLAPPLVLGQLMREWAFSELRGDSLEEVGLEHGIQVGGLVRSDVPRLRRVLPRRFVTAVDLIATGQITSFADGFTYWVGAEAPAGIAGVPEDPIDTGVMTIDFFGFTEEADHQPNGNRIAFWAPSREAVDKVAEIVRLAMKCTGILTACRHS